MIDTLVAIIPFQGILLITFGYTMVEDEDGKTIYYRVGMGLYLVGLLALIIFYLIPHLVC